MPPQYEWLLSVYPRHLNVQGRGTFTLKKCNVTCSRHSSRFPCIFVCMRLSFIVLWMKISLVSYLKQRNNSCKEKSYYHFSNSRDSSRGHFVRIVNNRQIGFGFKGRNQEMILIGIKYFNTSLLEWLSIAVQWKKRDKRPFPDPN